MHFANKVRIAAVVGLSLWLSAAFAGTAFAQPASPSAAEKVPAVDSARPTDNVIVVNVCSAYVVDSVEYNCCKNGIKEGTPDWDCCTGKSLECDDGDMCTTDSCQGTLGLIGPDGKIVSGGVAKCQHVKNIRCININTCSKKYFGDENAIKCCEAGAEDPAMNKCCVQHIAHKEPFMDEAGNFIPCRGNETCPTCPECKPPVIDCGVIADPDMKACCVAKGGMLYFVMDSCAKTSSDCNIIANIGGDVNGQVNICCNVLNNTGTITDSTISQACNNITGGGTSGATTGGTPTTPEGGSPTALTCAVSRSGEPVDGKWQVTYSAPASIGPVASATLIQLSGTQIRVDGGADDGGFGSNLTSPKSMATKAISDLSNPPPFDVTSPAPTSMMGNWEAPFQVKVSLSDLGGSELASATCTDAFKLEAKGGSGCGCFLGTGPVDFGANATLLLTLFAGVPWLLRKKRNRSTES